MTTPPSAAAVEAVKEGLLAYLEPWLHFAVHGQPLRAELHNAAVIAARDAAPHIAAADRLAQRCRLIATCEAMDPPWNPDGVRSLLTQDGTIEAGLADRLKASWKAIGERQAVQAERERILRLVEDIRSRTRIAISREAHTAWHEALTEVIEHLSADRDNALTSENTKGNTL